MTKTDCGWRRLIYVAVGLALFVAACGGGDVATDGEDTLAASRFVGLAVEDAAALADSEDRLWRIGRDGEEFFAMDASLIEGRVTFEVDDGTVTSASIESEAGPTDTEPDDVTDDPVLAQLQADAIVQLVTVDHSFASDTIPFDTVIVASAIADTSQPVQPLALELVAASIERDAAVKFTQTPDAEIADLAAAEAAAVAVVEIEDVRLDGDRAEIDLGLWCGTVCGVYLTYTAELDAQHWTITGTSGPVAVS